MLDAGEAAFLQQAHRNNWQKYAASLQPEAATGWDLCILTASDERQAAMYRQQLAWRRESGLLPARTEFVVLPDPAGRQAGSGGATLFALSAAARLRQAKAESAPPCPEDGAAARGDAGRVLIIHSGGDSRRLPHCSATGKLFARIPRMLPDRRWSTVFDEFLITLSGLAGEGLPAGVLVASGDVLLVFDHLQLSFLSAGLIGVTAAAPARMGAHHGAYVSGDGGHRVRAYLHKPSEQELAEWDAVGPDGLVQIDTGLLWFDAATAAKLVTLAERLALMAPQDLADDQAEAALPTLNLYGDLLLPTAQSTTRDAYLAHTNDGPATPGLQAARCIIWDNLHNIPLSVEHLQPAVFVHLGASREYWQMTAGDRGLAQLCGWSGIEPGAPALINAWLAPASIPAAALPSAEQRAALLSDSCLEGPLSWEGAALVAGVHTAQALALGTDMVIHQLPLAGGGFVTRLFGLHDDPKQAWDSPGATFFNRPWPEWLAATRISPEALWDGVPEGRRTLWTARLYPLSQEREESLALALPLAAGPAGSTSERVEDGWRARWAAAPRLSLGESLLRADGERILADIVAVEDQVATRSFCAAVESEQPAQAAAPVLGATRSVLARRAGPVAAHFASGGPLLCLRGYKALAEATGDNAWESRALATLARMIEQATPRPTMPAAPGGRQPLDTTSAGGRTPGVTVRALASARIDFGGGWSDTPPHSIERGGTVLNAALTLRGAYPISAEAEWLAEPRLILESRDIDTAIEVGCLAELLAYTNPADPFALHKAALVLRGLAGAEHAWTGAARGTADLNRPMADVMRTLGGGLRLTTQTGIPRGSGLGTSSIMAGAVLACLEALLEGRPDGDSSVEASSPPSEADAPASAEARRCAAARLFDEVLCLEQMLTTGGGWQDQVGGLTGGVKLVTTGPGLPQQIRITPSRLSPEAETGLGARLLLVYTGQQRLAKNLLRAVMGRWMARDPEMVWLLHQIGQLAQAMRYALEAGDLSCFGALLSEHWALNKRMDPGCTNPFIDELFAVMTPYISGAKLAGAGGGGFVTAIAHDAVAADELAKTLVSRYPGTPVRVWPCAVPREGLQIQWGKPTFGEPT